MTHSHWGLSTVREFQLPRQFFKSGIGLGIAGLLKNLNNNFTIIRVFTCHPFFYTVFNLVTMTKKMLSNRVVISGDLGQNFVASSHGFC